MYEYLHGCGMEFYIEPTSASGEADMISLQSDSQDPLIADAKVFNPERSHGKAYVIKGVHQLYRYACDYNEAVGYLIIFNTSARPDPIRAAQCKRAGSTGHPQSQDDIPFGNRHISALRTRKQTRSTGGGRNHRGGDHRYAASRVSGRNERNRTLLVIYPFLIELT